MWIRIKMTSGIRVRTKTFQICKFFLELFRKTIFQGSYQGGKKQEICDYKMIILVLPLWKQVFLYFF